MKIISIRWTSTTEAIIIRENIYYFGWSHLPHSMKRKQAGKHSVCIRESEETSISHCHGERKKIK